MKNALLRGTLILTITGFLTRIIGFFYKIFLSKELGAHGLGIYQLIFPVYGICFTLFAAGIQTAISQMVAGSRQTHSVKKIMVAGILLSELIAIPLTIALFLFAEPIAKYILSEPACADSIRILGLAFPFAGVTACINGVYYGRKQASIPAYTQLVEQMARVVVVYLLARTCEMAVFGLVAGEIASCLFNLLSLRNHSVLTEHHIGIRNIRVIRSVNALVRLSFPLTMTRLVMSLLHSLESILIPLMLKCYGLSARSALSIYGILTGMAMPFLLFPSAITNSMAVLLLPTIAESSSRRHHSKIQRTSELTVQYSLLIGYLTSAIFFLFGKDIGIVVFHSKDAGYFLFTLSAICPFLYVSTTLTSIMNGLGKMHLTFFNTIAGLSVRIACLLLLVPRYGMMGYLFGLLTSQLLTCVLDYLVVFRTTRIQFDFIEWLWKPISVLTATGFLTRVIYNKIIGKQSSFQTLAIACLLYCSIYLFFLFRWQILSFPQKSTPPVGH